MRIQENAPLMLQTGFSTIKIEAGKLVGKNAKFMETPSVLQYKSVALVRGLFAEHV